MARVLCVLCVVLGVLVGGMGVGVARGGAHLERSNGSDPMPDRYSSRDGDRKPDDEGKPPGGGDPEPSDDPDRPGEEVGVTGFWVAVDNGGIACQNLTVNPPVADGLAGVPDLTGISTFDLYLRMPEPHRLLVVESNPLNSHLTISGGAAYQYDASGGNVEPNPNLIPIFPCLEFDSYLVFEDVAAPIAAPQPSAPSIIGLNSRGGVSALSESTWSGAFGAIWFLVPPPSILAEQNTALFGDGLYYVRIARFSLPSGVSIGGELNASLTLTGSGQTASVTGIPVPTVPSTCVADLNNNGLLDSVDLGIMLGAFGISDAGDVNGDGVTDTVDLGILLGAFGRVCE